jgi:hypothetical protein
VRWPLAEVATEPTDVALWPIAKATFTSDVGPRRTMRSKCLRLSVDVNISEALCSDEGSILSKLEELGQRPDHRS